MAARTFRIETLPHKRPVPMVLSPEEVPGILKAAEPFYRAFFLCLYTLGLRMNEARQLKWEDIDFKAHAVRIQQKGGTRKILPLSAWTVEEITALRLISWGEISTSGSFRNSLAMPRWGPPNGTLTLLSGISQRLRR
jgi:integrase